MVSVALIQNNFGSGEVSPLIEGQVTAPRYQAGLRACQNFLPLRQGGLAKRPGTAYAGNTRNNAKARLFETDIDGTPYVIEVTGQKTRIWRSDHTLEGGGVPIEITTPWTEADIPHLHASIMRGVLYFTHPEYALRTFTLTAGTWTLATPTFSGARTFSAANKYPATAFFRAGRLGLAGMNDEPNSMLLSRSPDASAGTDRFTDITLGINADDAIYIQESDAYGSTIRWGIGALRLIVGSDRAIWMDSGDVTTPASFDMTLVSNAGAGRVRPVLIDNIVLYTGREDTSLHALIYSDDAGGFVDYDLSKDAEHLFVSPIVDMKIQTTPDPILWLVRADGLLLSLSIDMKNGIAAWAKHPMDGLVESVAVTGSTVWLTVKRGLVRHVEYIDFKNLSSTAQADFHYVDDGLTLTFGSPTATVTGLSHLEGKTVTAWADGAALPDAVVTSGSVTYSRTFSKIHIGLKINSYFETLRPEIPVNGTSQGKQKRIEKIAVRLYRSAGGRAGARTGTQSKFLTWVSGQYKWGETLELYTGDIKVEVASALDPDAVLTLTHDEPMPFTMLAVYYSLALMEVE